MSLIETDAKAYERITTALKRRSDGISAADLVTLSGLPLETVKTLLPKASDEFGARLKVTESGEILYSFPQGFKSRYRGFGPAAQRTIKSVGRILAKIGKLAFKVWIAVMLVGYFLLFIALALVALTASVAVSVSGSSNNRSSSRRSNNSGLGGFYLVSRIFDLIIRIWFYSEVMRPNDRRFSSAGGNNDRKARLPLPQAVFSFVFGDGDPNADWETREKKAVSAYIQANKGIISLPEFMMLTGLPPELAERTINTYLFDFNGSPEATDDGTVVYRFDELMMRADTKDRSFSDFSAPLKRPKVFSVNTPGLNRWFIIFNAVNLFFGSYFIYFTATIGPIVHESQVTVGSYLYAITVSLLSSFGNPIGIIGIGLGVIPLVFAALFYLVPIIRRNREQRENRAIIAENSRKDFMRRVWLKPLGIQIRDKDQDVLEENLIKELSTYAIPEINLNAAGSTEYNFPNLLDEKKALERYRATIKDISLGKTIFDSHSN